MNKLVALEGDVSLPNFGLSINDLQLLFDNVSIVFHSAATVRFDQDLKTAMEMNVEGPRSMLKKNHIIFRYVFTIIFIILLRLWFMFQRLTSNQMKIF